MNIGYKSFITSSLCKYFIPSCDLSLHSLNNGFVCCLFLCLPRRNLVKSHLPFFFFSHGLCFGVRPKKSTLNSELPSRFSSVLPSRIDIILHFTFRSKIYLELIFVKGISSISVFFFFGMPMSSSLLFYHCLLKSLSLL